MREILYYKIDVNKSELFLFYLLILLHSSCLLE